MRKPRAGESLREFSEVDFLNSQAGGHPDSEAGVNFSEKIRSLTSLRSGVRQLSWQHSEANSPRQKRFKINPLLRYDRNKVTSLSINRDEFTITVTMEKAEPLTIWFQSLAQLEQAYSEWEWKEKQNHRLDGK
jgi:hypothetical protein